MIVMKKILLALLTISVVLSGCATKLTQKEYVKEGNKIVESAQKFHEDNQNDNSYGGIAIVRENYATTFNELAKLQIKGVEMGDVIVYLKMMEQFEKDAYDLFIAYKDKSYDELSKEEQTKLSEDIQNLYGDDFTDIQTKATEQVEKLKEDKKITEDTYEFMMTLFNLM